MPNNSIQLATRRAMQFLRPPAEKQSERDWALYLVGHYVELAVEQAIRAGEDDLGFALRDMEGRASRMFADRVHGSEIEFLDREIAALEVGIAEIKAAASAQPPVENVPAPAKPSRKLAATKSAGTRARAKMLKTGATAVKI